MVYEYCARLDTVATTLLSGVLRLSTASYDLKHNQTENVKVVRRLNLSVPEPVGDEDVPIHDYECQAVWNCVKA